MLNGRAFGDIFGKHTCFQYNGNSAVDYCIVSESLFRNVLFFHFQELKSLLSDHAVITKHYMQNTCQIKEMLKPSVYLCLE